MCGRYTLRSSGHTVAKLFDLADVPDLTPRFNMAPTQEIPIIRADAETGNRSAAFVRWGLVPSWADDPSIGNRMINARAETVATKPAFRGPFKRHRCLIVCDGFYEWKKVGSKKQPYLISMRDGQPFGFAGLWDEWTRDGEIIESATIITTEANALMRDLHDRMPVIIPPKNYSDWLDPSLKDKEASSLTSLLKPFASEAMVYHPVSTLVNNPRHEDPRCVEPHLT